MEKLIKDFASFFEKLESLYGKLSKTSKQDYFKQMILGILMEGDNTEAKALSCFEHLQKVFVDWNEVRVTSEKEIYQEMNPFLKGAEIKSYQLKRFLVTLCTHHRKLDLTFTTPPHYETEKFFFKKFTDTAPLHFANLYYHHFFYENPIQADVIRVFSRLKACDLEKAEEYFLQLVKNVSEEERQRLFRLFYVLGDTV
ncbi:MAG: hypothetical protein AABZ60_13150, partial [Planctomycetota bacterium]